MNAAHPSPASTRSTLASVEIARGVSTVASVEGVDEVPHALPRSAKASQSAVRELMPLRIAHRRAPRHQSAA